MVSEGMAINNKTIRQHLDFVMIIRHEQRATTNSLNLESKLQNGGMSLSGKMVLELFLHCIGSCETKDVAKSSWGQGRQ